MKLWLQIAGGNQPTVVVSPKIKKISRRPISQPYLLLRARFWKLRQETLCLRHPDPQNAANVARSWKLPAPPQGSAPHCNTCQPHHKRSGVSAKVQMANNNNAIDKSSGDEWPEKNSNIPKQYFPQRCSHQRCAVYWVIVHRRSVRLR